MVKNINDYLSNLEKRFESIQTDAEKIASEFEEKLAVAREKLAVATTKMDDASRSDDLEAYRKAFREVQDLTAEEEFYQTRIDAKHNKALLTKEEYEQICKEIESLYYAMELEKAREILPLLINLRDTCVSVNPVINRANEVLNTLVFKIMKLSSSDTRNFKQIEPSLPILDLGRQLTNSTSRYVLAGWLSAFESVVNGKADPDDESQE